MNCPIKIHDMHLTDGRTERSQTVVCADVEGSAGHYTLKYDEQSEEMKGCRTSISVTGGCCVEITREGSYGTAMKIEKGRRNLCRYSTPVGNFMMGISGSMVSSEFKNGRFVKLEFAYALDAEGTLLSKNRIRITAE